MTFADEKKKTFWTWLVLWFLCFKDFITGSGPTIFSRKMGSDWKEWTREYWGDCSHTVNLGLFIADLLASSYLLVLKNEVSLAQPLKVKATKYVLHIYIGVPTTYKVRRRLRTTYFFKKKREKKIQSWSYTHHIKLGSRFILNGFTQIILLYEWFAHRDLQHGSFGWLKWDWNGLHGPWPDLSILDSQNMYHLQILQLSLIKIKK